MNNRKQSLKLRDKIILLLVGVVTIYFLSIVAFPKLIVTETSYTDYYWFRAPWLFIHVVAGLLGTLIGWYQFIPNLRNKYWKIHRVVGRIYLISISIAALTAVYLAYTSPGVDLMGKFSFAIIPFVWIGTITFGYLAIRKRKVVQHQEWMLRSYVVTFFFTIFVIITKYLPYESLGVTFEQSVAVITWFSWAVPLFITELIIQGRKIFK